MGTPPSSLAKSSRASPAMSPLALSSSATPSSPAHAQSTSDLYSLLKGEGWESGAEQRSRMAPQSSSSSSSSALPEDEDDVLDDSGSEEDKHPISSPSSPT